MGEVATKELKKGQARRLVRGVRLAFASLVEPRSPVECEAISDVVDALVDRLPTVRDGPSLRQGVLERIRNVVGNPEITENTLLAEVVTEERRRELWRALQREFPRSLPALETNVWLSFAIGIALAVALAVIGVRVGGALWGAMAGVVLTMVIALPFATKLTKEMSRVKDVIDGVLQNPKVAKGDELLWTRAQIAEVVIAIARAQTKVHGLTEATTFAESVAMR